MHRPRSSMVGIRESCGAAAHLSSVGNPGSGWGRSMSQVPAWFERKFEFSFRVELYPNLMARLRGTPARLEDVLRGCSHKILIVKPQEKWSAQEHAGHLLELEPLWLARVDDYVAGSVQLTVADLQNRKTDEANHNA